MRLDIKIQGEVILTAGGSRRGEVGIRDGRVQAVGPDLGPAARIIEAPGCLVLPGIIDAHTHFGIKMGRFQARDDWETGPLAAAAAGITTFIDFVGGGLGEPLLEAAERRAEEITHRSCLDFSLHVMVSGREARLGRQVERLLSEGWPSFKIFTTYRRRGLMIEPDRLQELLGMVGRRGVVAAHCEDDERVSRGMAREAARPPGPGSAIRLARARTGEAEAAAVTGLLAMARRSRSRVHLVHLTSRLSLPPLARARCEGALATAETCPQYLLLPPSRLTAPEGHRLACCPPLRTRPSMSALWAALQEGLVDMIATDHCAFAASQKDRWREEFTRLPFGIPGVETLLPVVAAAGRRRGLPWSLISRLLSEGPARVHGLFPRKGSLLPGSDADILVLEPRARWKVDHHRLRLPLGWSPFQGLPGLGRVRHVLRRGEVLVQDGELVAGPGGGRRVPRSFGSAE